MNWKHLKSADLCRDTGWQSMSETQAGKLVKFLVPLVTTRRDHREGGQYAYCLEYQFEKTLNLIFYQIDKVRKFTSLGFSTIQTLIKYCPLLPTADPKTGWRQFASFLRLAALPEEARSLAQRDSLHCFIINPKWWSGKKNSLPILLIDSDLEFQPFL